MAEPVSTGMDRGEMRKVLGATKQQPVHCAVGLGKDPSVGLLLLDRIKAPKVLEKQLMLAIPDTKNTRWGTAAVDWEVDPKLVKLYLNKPIAGMARKLVKTLKGTGFSKVQIMLDDGTEVEGAADEEAAEAAAPPPAPPPPEAAAPGPDAGELTRQLAALIPRVAQVADASHKAEMAKLASQSNVNIKTGNLIYAATTIQQLAKGLDEQPAAPPPAPPAPPPPPPAAAQAGPGHDASELSRMLAGLVPRIAAAAGEDAARKAALMKFATDANVNIKTNNLTYAATAIAQLRTALDGAGPGAPAAAAPAAVPAGTVAFAKSRLAWLAARKRMESDIDKLRDEIVATYQDEDDVADLEKRYRSRVSPLLSVLDESLADKLDEATNATDPAARAKLVAEAKAIIKRYQGVMSAEPLIADLDDNPFVPLSIAKTMTATLTALSAALH